MKIETRRTFGWPSTPARGAPCKNGLVAHYDGSPSPRGVATMAHEKCREYWRWCRGHHMSTNRWKDIGYSFGICGHGIVFEGRGFGREQAAQPGGNTTWMSVTFMLGKGEEPTDEQLATWLELRAWLRGKGVAAAVRGHRDFVSTTCPGGPLYALVKDGSLRKPAPVAEPKPPATAPPWPGRVFVHRRPMMHGPDVLAWQRQMKKRGWQIRTDGFYDERAAAVARAFQEEKRLRYVDGKVGEETWVATWKARVTLGRWS